MAIATSIRYRTDGSKGDPVLTWLAGALMLTTTTQATVHKESWGKLSDGVAIELYTISDRDLTVKISTYGARVVAIETPDRTGKKADVVLGYNGLKHYSSDRATYFGATVGRYANRIAHGSFVIGNETYRVPPNNNGNALHGGPSGFDQRAWTAKEVKDGVEMTMTSLDGDQGFPGALTVHVTFTVHDNALTIDYVATTTKPTVVNLTNHAYFNLHGEGSGDVLDHQLTILADKYTPVDAGLIPTGSYASVEGTPFDFRKSTAIGARIAEPNEQLELGHGYDHNYVLGDNPAQHVRLAAEAYDPKSGRVLTVKTSEPGVQLYTGNFLDGTLSGKAGVKYGKRSGFCLETQHFPDSPNHPEFPTTLVVPTQPLKSTTVYAFSTRK
jgi:aldose 1-epimerase